MRISLCNHILLILSSWCEQVALGKTAKENERYFVTVTTEDLKNIVLGTLIKNKCDQIHLDLVFNKEFTLTHSGSGGIFFSGYGTQSSEELYPPNAGVNYLLRHLYISRDSKKIRYS